MQEGDGFFRKLARDAGSIVGVDSRPLLLAFAMCAGAAAYLSAPFEPHKLEIAGLLATGIAVLLLVRWLHQADLIYAVTLSLFGLVLGFSAGAVRSWLVERPVIAEETRPIMLEGWVANIEAGQKGARLKIKVHSIAGFGAEQQPKLIRVTHRARLDCQFRNHAGRHFRHGARGCVDCNSCVVRSRRIWPQAIRAVARTRPDDDPLFL